MQLLAARATWEADRQNHRGGVEVPHALEAKYPQVAATWAWFWMFPSPTYAVDPRTGVVRRHHLFEERLQRALKRAVAQAGSMIYTHVLKVAAGGIASPLDALSALHPPYDCREPASLYA